jgi:hypothetical protein
LALSVCAQAAPQTMRVDYFHTGDAKQELFSFDRAVIEPLPWPGDLNKGIDDSNLGKYFFEVRDQKTQRVLYSRGFASVYGEWETTDEAQKIKRSFSESFRFPAPDAAIEIFLKKRDAKNDWVEIWKVSVDPKDIFIDRSKSRAPAQLIPIQKMGDPATKVDLLLLGDGYTAREIGKFQADAPPPDRSPVLDLALQRASRRFQRLGALSAGVTIRNLATIHRNLSRLDLDIRCFGSERYILAFDNQRLRKVAQFAPYEFIEILANGRTYGGGGIFNLYSTVAVDNAFANYVFVHEFGHHFAALADEYYTSPVAYAPAPAERIEPWEPNATALLDKEKLKWKDLVAADTPLPTPWAKDAFEAYEREYGARRAKIRKENRPESEMEALFREDRRMVDAMMAKEKYAGKVGAFEGCNYEAKGYYRPQADCIMFSRTDYFCAVCRRAIERVVGMYAR